MVDLRRSHRPWGSVSVEPRTKTPPTTLRSPVSGDRVRVVVDEGMLPVAKGARVTVIDDDHGHAVLHGQHAFVNHYSDPAARHRRA